MARSQLQLVLQQRMEMLRRIALSKRPIMMVHCSKFKFVVITEIPFGNSGNNMIEFTHGVWFASKLNATLVVPKWMSPILRPFNLTILHSQHCFIEQSDYDQQKNESNSISGSNVIEVTSEDSYFAYKLFSNSQHRGLLPPFSPLVLQELSEHFLRVYCAFWCSPNDKIVSAGNKLIAELLDNHLGYTAVHKRSMEGGCNYELAVNTVSEDFSPLEISKDVVEWKGRLHKYHPICEMPASQTVATQLLLSRNGSKVFVAFDGRGDVSDYKKLGAVFSSVLDSFAMTSSHEDGKLHERKFVDMFVAMHADLFILNPRSTFSWEIYLIRVCLALESVPILKEKDLYVMHPNKLVELKRPLWVSWLSVVDAYFSL